MRRAVMGVALFAAVFGLALLGGEVWMHRPPHTLTLQIGAGLTGAGLLIAALLTDPKSVLAFAQSLAAFKWGRREAEQEGEKPGEAGR